VPAGTRVPLSLKNAISTKNARRGDRVYAQTNFPVTANDKLVIPAGTYVQGVIARVQRAGRVKGRAEVLFHFTTLVFPNGYTVMLPSAIESLPGAENASMKDKEGTIQGEGQGGSTAATVGTTAATGTVVGGVSHGAKGALIGGGIGAAAGTAVSVLTRGNDVRLEPGTTLEMVLARPLTLDESRVRAQP
jgi:type IV secretion system protein VirB10